MSIEVVTPNPETLRDEWFVQPILPTTEGPREWRRSEEEALDMAKTCAVAYNCPYEVYKRTHYVYVE